jgi:hypothetical protein
MFRWRKPKYGATTMDWSTIWAEHGLTIFGAAFSFGKIAIGYAVYKWSWSDPINDPVREAVESTS